MGWGKNFKDIGSILRILARSPQYTHSYRTLVAQQQIHEQPVHSHVESSLKNGNLTFSVHRSSARSCRDQHVAPDGYEPTSSLLRHLVHGGGNAMDSLHQQTLGAA